MIAMITHTFRVVFLIHMRTIRNLLLLPLPFRHLGTCCVGFADRCLDLLLLIDSWRDGDLCVFWQLIIISHLLGSKYLTIIELELQVQLDDLTVALVGGAQLLHRWLFNGLIDDLL